MSGGVDSSTVAALLAEEGYNVIGLTMQLYDHGEALAKKGACCAGQDIHDARQVAEQLGFPHYVLNYESRFKEAVMNAFAESYLRGETPIPCVRCNQTVKFRDMLGMAKELGADVLATGHYVHRTDGPEGPELHIPADRQKDQSYFLFTTTRPQLDFLRFPLGLLTKEETRLQAKRLGLLVDDKPDSQDICFVPGGNYASVVAKLRPEAYDPGEIVHLDGTVLGRHEGIIHFTVGQRRGLRVAVGDPLYVIRVEPETRRVIVGPREALGQTELWIQDINWLAAPIPADGLEASVKLRSTMAPVPATLHPPDTNGKARVVLHQPEDAITPGQACVAYDGTRVLGGGWIIRG
ncbi:MAG: tRNA 2-thiouridine(34) synthase MnmA [Hyphomicrobiales bacterium]|nr:tRNA 2-thiouridine(34) synthase MnmA [Hyphomicrobiales bacterium]